MAGHNFNIDREIFNGLSNPGFGANKENAAKKNKNSFKCCDELKELGHKYGIRLFSSSGHVLEFSEVLTGAVLYCQANSELSFLDYFNLIKYCEYAYYNRCNNDLNKPIRYAGIGSRKTPEPILEIMYYLARCLAHDNVCLVSGGADGADSAFAEGFIYYIMDKRAIQGFGVADCAEMMREQLNIIRPEKASMNGLNLAWQLLGDEHWKKCDLFARLCHGRNIDIITGKMVNNEICHTLTNLKEKQQLQPNRVRFVVCWTEGGRAVGGTATGIRIANELGIMVYNLYNPSTLDKIKEYIDYKTAQIATSLANVSNRLNGD